jgi:nucleolin
MTNTLFVNNLSWSVSENTLYDLFSSCGQVQSVRIPTDRDTGRPRGFAFIEMTTADDAQSAIRMFHGYMLEGRDLVVALQDQNRDRGGAGGGGSRSAGGSSSGASPNSKLFVRSLAYNVTEQDLNDLFGQLGQVLSVKIPMDRETNRSKGFAFVEMGTADEAKAAIDELNGTELDGRAIAIDFQDPNRAKPTGAGGGGGRGRW